MIGAWRDHPAPLLRGHGLDVDFPLLVGCSALLALGVVMIGSASTEVAAAMGDSFYYIIRQLVYLLIALGCGALALLVPIPVWSRLSGPLLLLAFALLALVLVPGIGREVKGAARWIGLGPVNLQPSEPAKLFAILFLAGYLLRRQQEVRESWGGFIKPFVVLLPMALLLLAEPDFGATVVLMGASGAMLFLGGVGYFRFGILLLLALIAVLFLVQDDYRMSRLVAFADPWADQFGGGYQLVQALIAFGRGGWFGIGLGNSVQKQFYLPEAHTDFVFSILAEELGMVGALITVALFVFVGIRALLIGQQAARAGLLFGAYLAWGVAFLWLGQFLINVGVNIGLLPTKGLTLPFLSYGGSSLIVSCISMAMVMRVEWETRQYLAESAAPGTEAGDDRQQEAMG